MSWFRSRWQAARWWAARWFGRGEAVPPVEPPLPPAEWIVRIERDGTALDGVALVLEEADADEVQGHVALSVSEALVTLTDTMHVVLLEEGRVQAVVEPLDLSVEESQVLLPEKGRSETKAESVEVV